MNLIAKVINIDSELSQEEVNTLLKNWQVFPVKPQDDSIPLGIIIVNRFDRSSKHLPNDLERKLKSFLNLNYASKATLVLDSASENAEFQSEESIARLFQFLKGNPTLILESLIEGNCVSLRLAYWGLKDNDYSYTQILDCYRSDRLDNSDYLANFILNYCCLIAGWMIDYYQLKDFGKSPVLPRLLPEFIKVIDLEEEKETILASLFSGYDSIYKKLVEERPKLIAKLDLELDKSLIELNKISLGKKIVKSSFKLG